MDVSYNGSAREVIHMPKELRLDPTQLPTASDRTAALPPRSKIALPATPRGKAYRVIIVHGVPVIRYGMRQILQESCRFRVCAETDSVPVARSLIVEESPDVVVLGLTLRGGDGFGLLRDLPKLNPTTRAVAFSLQQDRRTIERVFRAGASGYVFVQDHQSEVAAALEQVARGECYASVAVLEKLRTAHQSPFAREQCQCEVLSDREFEVLSLIGRGFGASRVAAELRLSVKTIETYQAHLKYKLGIGSAAELSARATQLMLHVAQRDLQARAEMLSARRRA